MTPALPRIIMYFYVILFLLFIHFRPVFNRVDRLDLDERQKDVLHETVGNLLLIDQDRSIDPDQENYGPEKVHSKSARAAAKYMRRLFERYRKHEIKNDPGFGQETRTIVRAITPKIGRFGDRDALIFDLRVIKPSEIVIKSEIHYYFGRHLAADVQNGTHVRCYALTRSNISNGKPIRKTDLELAANPHDVEGQSPHWAVFDALDLVNRAVHQFEKSPRILAVVFGRSVESGWNRLRISPVRKTLRSHAPFLSISTRDTIGLSMIENQSIDDQEADDEESDEMNDGAVQNRRKRDVDAKYYEYYHPYDTPYTTSPNDVGLNWNRAAEDRQDPRIGGSDFVQRGPSILRQSGRNGEQKQRKRGGRWRQQSLGRRTRTEYLTDDHHGVWTPFEADESGKSGGKSRKKKRGKVLKPKEGDENPTTVVLLEENRNVITCRRNDLVVEFRDIGWGDYVIAPSSFEAHYCAGSCQFPVPATVNTTNHAILLDIIQKMRLHPQIPKPCCAPEKMDSLSLLYYDSSGNVVLTTYPKMSVVSCACL